MVIDACTALGKWTPHWGALYTPIRGSDLGGVQKTFGGEHPPPIGELNNSLCSASKMKNAEILLAVCLRSERAQIIFKR